MCFALLQMADGCGIFFPGGQQATPGQMPGFSAWLLHRCQQVGSPFDLTVLQILQCPTDQRCIPILKNGGGVVLQKELHIFIQPLRQRLQGGKTWLGAAVLNLGKHISGHKPFAQLPLGKTGRQPGRAEFFAHSHKYFLPGNWDLPNCTIKIKENPP